VLAEHWQHFYAYCTDRMVDIMAPSDVLLRVVSARFVQSKQACCTAALHYTVVVLKLITLV
jgi:hypothetical protein